MFATSHVSASLSCVATAPTAAQHQVKPMECASGIAQLRHAQQVMLAEVHSTQLANAAAVLLMCLLLTMCLL
jgi:hypothetical protein